jgi:hypothetical protein
MAPIIEEQSLPFEPGVYLAEVRDCKQTVSKTSGNEMFEVSWKAVGFPSELGDLTTDYITFGKKAAGVTKAKLGALGFEVGDDVKPTELLGKRAWLQIEHQTRAGYAPSCKVAMSFDDGCRAGYWPEEELPENVESWVVKPPTPSASAAVLDDTPF